MRRHAATCSQYALRRMHAVDIFRAGFDPHQDDLLAAPGPLFSSIGVEHDLARRSARRRSEEHTSELQSLMRISYAVFCLKKKKNIIQKCIVSNNILTRQRHTK